MMYDFVERRWFITVIVAMCLGVSVFAGPQLRIVYPGNNAHVSGKTIELTGTGADPNGQLEVSVMTDDWFLQNGRATIESNGNWTYSPVYISGQGEYNNHIIRVTVIKKGIRGPSATI